MSATIDPVFTLGDLPGWSFPGTALAVLGYPIKHSISPPMHNAALARMTESDHRFSNWRYFRFEIPPDDLPKALNELHAKGFTGLNLTVPHKVIAVNCIGKVDSSARPVGAVNTLRRTATGWEGFNTDGYGMATALKEQLGVQLEGADVLLLGAGGAARGGAVECLQRRCRSLWIANRTRANLENLITQLTPIASGSSIHAVDPSSLPEDLPENLVVINATSAGLKAGDPLPIDLDKIPRPVAVMDMIYNPALPPLLDKAQAMDIPCTNGLSMLIHQGVRSLEIWSGAEVPTESMLTAATQALQNR